MGGGEVVSRGVSGREGGVVEWMEHGGCVCVDCTKEVCRKDKYLINSTSARRKVCSPITSTMYLPN